MKHVVVHEVGPRDGLQNEQAEVPTSVKIELINRLSAAGFSDIEATSFVSPRWVPQLADAAAVMAGIVRAEGVRYSVLTPNLTGYERARDAAADEVAIFASASETFSQKNINCSIAESIERFRPVLAAAAIDGIPVRGYVSCVANCPYEGAVAPAAVADVAEHLLKLGCHEISLGDTTGTGTTEQVVAMLEAVLRCASTDQLAGHFHDTHHRALDNVGVSLDLGLRRFDSAIGGAGGCPYSPGAKGNLSTTALADLLTERGYQTGLDRQKLQQAEDYLISAVLPR